MTICSGLIEERASALERELREAGAVAGLVPGELGQSVVLESCGWKKIAVIKAIRDATGYSLREAKQLVDRVDSDVRARTIEGCGDPRKLWPVVRRGMISWALRVD